MDRSPRFVIEPSREGPPTLAVMDGGARHYLHSRVAPTREAESLRPSFNTDKYDVLIVLGAGLGYHLLPLGEDALAYTRVLIIDILHGIDSEIARNPLTAFLLEQPVSLVAGCSMDEIEPRVDEFLSHGATRGIQVLEHPASLRLFPEYYDGARTVIRRALDRFSANIATRNAFARRYLRNAILNIGSLGRFYPVNALFDRLEGLPSVVITSGPTLDCVLPFIKESRSRIVIVAVDSALPVLSGAGITPDFAISIDPQQHVCEHFARGWPEGAMPVFSLTAYPLPVRRHGGLLSLNTHPVSQLIEELHPGAVGSIDSGTGTVAGDAILFAARLGLSPIALAGFDFCFGDHTIYARYTAYQRRFALFFQGRFEPIETRNLAYIMKSSGGHLVDGRFSRKSFAAYRGSIESLIRRKDIRNLYRLRTSGVSLAGTSDIEPEIFFSSFAVRALDSAQIIRSAIESFPVISQNPEMRALRNAFAHPDIRNRLLRASLPGETDEAIINSMKTKTMHVLNMEDEQ
ncbi:MAG TPA: 6-hydroxymethylpterin diphosphokinase MptE-like protein [Spirochaetota bacterium]|nr:6-hydroxymethylpterin diphosphokinase MptE-like protein [Spirochaetota bacterium]